MRKIKIAIIGAGSATFSLKFIQDLCRTPNLAGCTLSLMDIDEKKLDNTAKLCTRYADETNFKLKIEKTTDHRKSLEGADVVVDLALVVGYRGYKTGWAIAQKHGYKLGGSYHIMHDEGFWINYYQLRHIEMIARDILEICPEAWFLFLSNPVLAATTYIGRRYKTLKFAGLCHGCNGVYALIDALGLKKDDVSFTMSGVNHFLWLNDFRYKGQNAFGILDQWIETKAQQFWKTCSTCNLIGPKPVDLYKRFGAFPIGDTANPGGGAWPWWYHTDSATEASWQEDVALWWQKCAELTETWASRLDEKINDSSRGILQEFPPEETGEPTVFLIESLLCDIGRTFYVNILNDRNYVHGVPKDFEVEIPARVDGSGINGTFPPALPKAIIAFLLRDRVAPVEVELEAYEKHSRRRLLDLIIMDPWTRSERQAQSLLDDILNVPAFSEMKEYYK